MDPSAVIRASGLHAAAKSDLAAAWQDLRAQAGDERIYGFGFYTTYYASYLAYTAFTEEGLDKVADEYVARSENKTDQPATSFEAERTALRWSPADSPRHGDMLSHASPIAQGLSGAFDELDDLADWMESYYDTLAEVLNELADEGLFGVPRSVVLNIWEGDQSAQDRKRFARRCNPPELAERFCTEEDASYAAFLRRRH